jgi:hypothetical protein
MGGGRGRAAYEKTKNSSPIGEFFFWQARTARSQPGVRQQRMPSQSKSNALSPPGG